MLISPFSPIFFEPHKSDGIESRYMQTFADTDRILLQCLCSEGEVPDFTLSGETDRGRAYSAPVSFLSYVQGNGVTLRYAVITGLSNGVYRVTDNASGESSHLFRVTDDRGVLDSTCLIQYSMPDNRRRTDAVFVVGGMRMFFDFRIPGGFKDGGWTFGVDNEQFITADGDPVELFALESTVKRLTMGCQEGVPVYFAEMLNRILTCAYVYIDGVRYARSDSAVPEMNATIDGLDSFVFTQSVRRVNNLDPAIENANLLAVRRSGADTYRVLESDVNNTTPRITL